MCDLVCVSSIPAKRPISAQTALRKGKFCSLDVCSRKRALHSRHRNSEAISRIASYSDATQHPFALIRQFIAN